MKKVITLIVAIVCMATTVTNAQTTSTSLTPKSKGYFFMADVSYHIGVGSSTESVNNRFTGKLEDMELQAWDKTVVRVVNGYQFSQHFMMGVGIGFMTLYTPDLVEGAYMDGVTYGENMLSVPITLYARLNLTKTDVKPFIALNAGYNVGINESLDFRGGTYNLSGAMFEPSVGVAFPINKYDVLLSLGYSIIDMELNVSDNFNYIVPSGAVSVNLGFSF